MFAGGTPVQDGLGEWPLSEVAPLVRAAAVRKVPMTFVGVGVRAFAPNSRVAFSRNKSFRTSRIGASGRTATDNG